MIICKICNQVFKSTITWKHLKNHNITIDEYKKKYGPVVSEEFREIKSKQSSGKNNPNYGNRMSKESKEKISKANSGKLPHNKGKSLSENQKNILSKKAIERNKKWHETGNHPHVGKKRSESTKQKIKERRSEQIMLPETFVKAVNTKRANGYDLAFFKGKKHSDETKVKLSKISKKNAAKKHEKSIVDTKSRLQENGYTFVSYNDNVVLIECNTCKNKFSRTRQNICSSKIKQNMCNHCYPPVHGSSDAEKQIAEFIKQYYPVELNNRNIINPQEIDVYIPDLNIGIEYNGLYWHSELYTHQNYHIDKKNNALEKNINIIHVFEDEWIATPEIVKSRLLFIMGNIKNKIYARKCIIKEIDSKTANTFLKQNHIQGSGRSNTRIGLYYQNQLVSVMTFLKNDVSKNLRGWELNRFCSALNTHVIGGASKLFKYFISNYDPDTITSFSDIRWENGKTVYEKLGFDNVHTTPPNYWYFVPNEIKRTHRYSLRKPSDSLMSEKDLRSQQGYLRIYDCGSRKWVWKKKAG